jgi:hypothetical protein
MDKSGELSGGLARVIVGGAGDDWLTGWLDLAQNRIILPMSLTVNENGYRS